MISAVESTMERNLDRLGLAITNQARRSMEHTTKGHDYRPQWKQKGANRRSPGKSSRRFTTASSAPYNPPAVQRGRLQKSVHMERNGKLSRKVGTRVAYGICLELGTERMLPRPWLRPALHKFTGKTGEELWQTLLK